MTEALDADSQTLSQDLLQDLHGFLSLEAPFLIRDLPRAANEEELDLTPDNLDVRFESSDLDARNHHGTDLVRALPVPRVRVRPCAASVPARTGP